MQVLYYIVSFYEAILLVRIIMSWIQSDPNWPVVQWINALTEPVLEPVRRLLPLNRWGIDFSPIVVFLVIDFLKRAIL